MRRELAKHTELQVRGENARELCLEDRGVQSQGTDYRSQSAVYTASFLRVVGPRVACLHSSGRPPQQFSVR